MRLLSPVIRSSAIPLALLLLVGCSEGQPFDSSEPVVPGGDPSAPPPAPPGNPARVVHHVAPTGSSGGDGSSARPWDLASALGRGLRAGDTLWLHGGTYRGSFTSTLTGSSAAPIVVRQYPGERATIDGQLSIRGSYSTFWGFEVMSTVAGPGDVEGVSMLAPGTRLINLVVHDHGGNGIGAWSAAPNSEVYGSIVYNNGRQRQVPNFAHGIYGQNASGIKRIADNIVFNQFGYGLHLYGESGALRNFLVEDNVLFQNGAPATARQQPNLWLGGGTPASGASVLRNLVYKTANDGTNAYLGYTAQNEDLVARGNYIVGGSPVLRLLRWNRATVNDNTLVGSADMVDIEGGYSEFAWAGNHYYRQGDTAAKAWVVNGAADPFSLWKSRTGLGASDVAEAGRPAASHVVVQPNEYEPGRAHITIFNWSGQGSISGDLTGVLAPGQRYEVRNAQDFYGTPVQSGVYSGGSLTFPMDGVAPPQPVGGWLVAPPSTGPIFQSFVVLQIP